MTKAQQARKARLLPNGRPRWIRCYDNGGETFDRYTVVYTGRYRCCRDYPYCGAHFQYVGMSEHPFHPQGFGQHGEHDQPIDAQNGKWPPALGRRCHLGKRVRFEDLPEDCRRLVMQDYRELWGLEA